MLGPCSHTWSRSPACRKYDRSGIPDGENPAHFARRRTKRRANGKAKAEILEVALFGKVTPRVPASILQFAENVEVYADEEALSIIIEKHGKDAVIF